MHCEHTTVFVYPCILLIPFTSYCCQYSILGAIFDPNGPLFLVPVVVHSVVILLLNGVYREVAERLTRYENHKTTSNFDNSLIVKRFLFEAFDCYIALFYLAFYECDVLLLRSELRGLFLTDSIRRIGLETIIPLIMNYFSREKMNKNI